MHNLLVDLTERFQKATEIAFPELEGISVEVMQSQVGEYQFNSAMKFAKPLKSNPRAIAEKIIENVEKGSLIKKMEVAGPGFVNIFLDSGCLNQLVQKMSHDPRLGVTKPKNRQRVIVEFSSPNIAKELHVGHLRSTIIGESLARVFEFLGEDVIRLNHVGDWGTAFGMLIAYLKEEAPEVLSGSQETDLSHLVKWYVESKKRFDADSDFKKRAQLEVVALQSGEVDSLKAWNIICDISRKSYQEIYELLDVTLEERGESFYNPMLADTIADLEQKGLVEVSDGAKCIFPEGFKNRDGNPLPLMIQKSDGGYGYDTTDMAAMKHRIETEKVDRIIIITDAGQSTHFSMIAEASKMAGYINPQNLRFDHVPFGVVLGADGRKFRTREGEVEKLSDLLYNAIEKAKEILQERSPNIDPKELEQTAKALGLGAVKYADLSSHRTSDYTFSYDRMLRFEGNTAAYLMYSYVRIAGIKRKIGTVSENGEIQLEHPSEIALGLHLLRFVETLDQIASELLPNRLTDYLYNLADKFNAFYRDCQVEGTPQQDSRLLLCDLVARTMKTGLHLLGVKTVERM